MICRNWEIWFADTEKYCLQKWRNMVNRETDKCKNQQSNSALSVTTSAYYTECSTHTVRNIVDNPARFIIRLLFGFLWFCIQYLSNWIKTKQILRQQCCLKYSFECIIILNCVFLQRLSLTTFIEEQTGPTAPQMSMICQNISHIGRPEQGLVEQPAFVNYLQEYGSHGSH